VFKRPTDVFHDLDSDTFKRFLELAVRESYFMLDTKIYMQVDGVAMGSPLGPTLANVFMVHLEEIIMSKCPPNFKPVFYWRYVVDTIALFRDRQEAESFLKFINSLHDNIKFSAEYESGDCLNFLDVCISRGESGFATSVYRKPTFTGLGTNFYSFMPIQFKLNAVHTMLHRAYAISSSYIAFHYELDFLKKFFGDNNYPGELVYGLFKDFVSSKFDPPRTLYTVEKEIKYVRFPFLGMLHSPFRKALLSILQEFFTATDFKLVFCNSNKIGNFFNVKDRIPKLLRARVVYKFSCPRCIHGVYIGSTARLLSTRIACHKGVSFRTQRPLRVKEASTIRDHVLECGARIEDDNFVVLDSAQDDLQLRVLESLYIKKECPELNRDSSAVQLYIA